MNWESVIECMGMNEVVKMNFIKINQYTKNVCYNYKEPSTLKYIY